MKCLLLSIVSAFFLLICKSQTVDTDLIIKNVNVIDVVKGEVQASKYVVLKGDKILGIYNKEVTSSNSTVIVDGSGKYLIPGLWDMHTHYNWNYKYASPLLLANGITGVREMWGVMDTIKHIRAQISAGTLLAPDVYSAGNIIDGLPPIWPGSVGVPNAEKAAKEAEHQIQQGVDFLKVYSLLTKEAYQAIAKKSKEHNVPFAGHVPVSVSMWEAIEANQQSTEHLYGLLEACSSEPKKLSEFTRAEMFGSKRANFLIETFDRTLFDSLANTLAKSNTWLSPTLTVLQSIANLDDTTKAQDPKLEYLPKFLRQMWNPRNDFRFQNSTKDRFEASRKKFQFQLSLMGDLHKAGVKIIAGTDYPNPYCYPGFSLHDELGLMVKGGMPAAAALRTATYNPALFMGKEKTLGQVAVNQLANLVLLDANPLEDISNTKKINAVFLRGKYLNQEALEDLLQLAKEISAKVKGFGG